tara:strand:- start:3206 stop:4168 length:963 start_codon:yes stop_codon:yes gene_type:complete
MKKKILILGSEGYLGCTLIPLLIKKYKAENLVGFDSCYFGKNNNHKNFKIIKKSVSKIGIKDLKDVKMIIDLANISNDPASELNPNFTRTNNYLNKVRLIKMLKKINYFSKYIYISSCSVYGFNDKYVNEKSKTNPISLYAKYCLKTENFLRVNLKNKYSILRLGTLYGWSKRMRYDIAINKIIRDAIFLKKVEVNGGLQFRFFCNNKLAAESIIKLIDKKLENHIFNVGNINLNLNTLVKYIAKYIKVKNLQIISDKFNVDSRSYKVSKDKLEKHFGSILKGYNFKKTVIETYKNIKKDKFPFAENKITLNIYKKIFKN